MSVSNILTNVNIATLDPVVNRPYGLVRNAWVRWREGQIIDLGTGSPGLLNGERHIDGGGGVLTPGFVDCHTHLVYGGDRSDEFEKRLQGKSYSEIAKEGGGIMSTVRATRKAGEEELFESAKARILRALKSGVTTVEIKSGYGLNLEDELKMLRVIRKLNQQLPVKVHATCLAAHTVPNEYAGSADNYITDICRNLLPLVARQELAEAVDIFCEKIAFQPRHARQLFACAESLGFKIKGHVEQLSQSHGSNVLCEFSALSADHLEYLSEDQVRAMQQANVTAVLLPGAYYFLKEKQRPPIAALRKYRVPMAVATDANPGSSPVFSITTAANLASLFFELTPEEAIRGITVNAAAALGYENSRGMLKKGYDADFCLWPIESPVQLVYELPAVCPQAIWINGQQLDSGNL